ncbi:hypothetical protein FOL47_004225 [Perkinsus chesapeaki]|uniref:Uncharacterized protein n=1 Tax=Perkinsus chesapeaki TaxID=330153 RepID=A0A7J6M3R7_PERCH|nr:hypothetical protein FOL47_004225 [Perkinsus chesapeaki]
MSRNSTHRRRNGQAAHRVDGRKQASSGPKGRRCEGVKDSGKPKRPRADSMPQCIPFSNAASPEVKRVGRFEIEECTCTGCIRHQCHQHSYSSSNDDFAYYGDIPVVLCTKESDNEDDDKGQKPSGNSA